MRVKLISYTPNMLDVIYTGARTCYNTGSPIDMWFDVCTIPTDKKLRLVEFCIKNMHHSVLEHGYFTFSIEGISRATSLQLVRHRLCSFSQQSQRYCEFSKDNLKYVIPKTIQDNSIALELFEKTMNNLSEVYTELLNLDIPAEDARTVLPNASETNLNMTCNLREIIHICNERLCNSAQQEIRELVSLMRDEILNIEPWLEPYLQPKCILINKCTEGRKCCGYLNSYKKHKQNYNSSVS